MTLAIDLPTLRLTTLRTLTRQAAPLAVVHVSTPLEDLAPLLVDHRVWVVAVDDAGVLRGVLSHAAAIGALRVDPDGWVADHLARSSITLDAESEIAEAAATVEAAGADHVLVVSSRGHLLGVVDTTLLGTYHRAA